MLIYLSLVNIFTTRMWLEYTYICNMLVSSYSTLCNSNSVPIFIICIYLAHTLMVL